MRVDELADGLGFEQVVKQRLVTIVIAINTALEFHVDALALRAKSH
jgi:hypothetical protein